MSVKRSFATGRVGHLNHDKFPMIAGQWKTFENLASDTRKPGLLGACLTVATFTHWTPFSSSVESLYLDQIAVRMTMGAPRRSNKVPERQFYMSALGTKQKCCPVRHMSAIEG
jgi:hypothetical protein